MPVVYPLPVFGRDPARCIPFPPPHAELGGLVAQPLIAVVNTWSDVTPCNIHLRDLAEPVRDGIRAAGGTPIEFNTIVVTDGIAMGTSGMKASLMSRETITDSIELAVGGHLLDAMVIRSGVRPASRAAMTWRPAW